LLESVFTHIIAGSSIFLMDYAKSLHPSPCHFPLETLINTGDSEGKMKDEGFLRISILKKTTRG
jgi:hypothetical protein